jgi:hypothetical protein
MARSVARIERRLVQVDVGQAITLWVAAPSTAPSVAPSTAPS